MTMRIEPSRSETPRTSARSRDARRDLDTRRSALAACGRRRRGRRSPRWRASRSRRRRGRSAPAARASAASRSAASRARPRRRSTTSPRSTRSRARTARSACTCPGTTRPTRRRCARTPTTRGIGFDAMNSNTFQDNPSTTGDGAISYKFGSPRQRRPRRAQARRSSTTCDVIDLGVRARLDGAHGLAGRRHEPSRARPASARQFERVADGLREIHDALPADWRLFTEHKPYEPAFYSTRQHRLGLVAAARAGAG